MHILLYIYIILVCLLDFLWVFQIFTVTFSAKKLSSSTGRFANATLVRLAEFLSVGYKKGVRPVKDWNTPTNVEIDLMVYSILNVVSYAVYKAITIFCVLYIYILYSIYNIIYIKKSSLSTQCVIIMHTWACTNTQSFCKTESKSLLSHVRIFFFKKHRSTNVTWTIYHFLFFPWFLCFVLC